MLREEILKELSKLKTTDFYEFTCFNCNAISSRKVKNIKRSLKEDDKLFCSRDCLYKNTTKEKTSQYLCCNCGDVFTRLKCKVLDENRVYCGSHCAATKNNTGRRHSDETRLKIKSTLINMCAGGLVTYSYSCRFCNLHFNTINRGERYCSQSCIDGRNKIRVDLKQKTREIKKKSPKPLYSYIRFVTCKECSSIFYITNSKKHINFCKDDCRKTYVSRILSERLSKAENRVNLGRGKPSWMEQTFTEWLISHNIPFESEVQFKNHELSKFYYADFVFSQFSLIIELDGNHHKFTVEKDKIRDEYLKSYYNYDVMRITHKEYRSKSRIEEIKSVLKITE